MTGLGGDLRQRLRSSARLVALVRGLRGFVLGPPPARPPARTATLEDRVRESIDVDFVADDGLTPRLNLLIPTLDDRRAFAGVRSAIELFEAIGAHAPKRRIVSVAPMRPAVDTFGEYRSTAPDAPADGSVAQIVSLGGVSGARLAIGPRDVFVATFWTTAQLAQQIIDWQDATFGAAARSFGYVIQDFEPGFYPWSAQWLLARATYGDPERTIAFFNTSLLQQYFHAQGLHFAHEHAFEPRLWPPLRRAAHGGSARERRIVIYGRPSTPRNAFPLMVDGLRNWVERYPQAGTWSLVSVGQTHPRVELGGGMALESLGKLDLESYAELLRTSMIGLSMMVSPHPSFPPLEMAHLGMRVITNRFEGRDLASWHENIESLDAIGPSGIADALADLCDRLSADPGLGDRARPLRPDLLADTPQYPFAELAASLLGVHRGVAS
ncbi:MAG: hypothetical protein HYX57_04150 [Chloroflexi bacterium]|nr:hypothetical protein [Chloroflexota bacterium]